jgi:hypothetical protein
VDPTILTKARNFQSCSFRPPVDPTTRSSVDHRLRTRPCKRLLRGVTLTTRSLARSSRFVSNSSDILALTIYAELTVQAYSTTIIQDASGAVLPIDPLDRTCIFVPLGYWGGPQNFRSSKGNTHSALGSNRACESCS